jgi:predicted transcriptional regulator
VKPGTTETRHRTVIENEIDVADVVSDGTDAAALADLLADDCARHILIETKNDPCSASELSARLDTSEPTIYRRLERLRKHDLVSEEIRPVTDGKNYKVYRARLHRVTLELTDEGFESTVSRRERMADRFTRFVENR